MKWNDEVRDVDSCGWEGIYKEGYAKDLFDILKYGFRKLSFMKQENVRMALKDKDIGLLSIDTASGKCCGYCFKYHSYDDEGVAYCPACPLIKKNDTQCFYLTEWNKMNKAKTKKIFAKNHKAWCEKLGLWNEGWE